jgi:hypothetical protein
VFGDLHRECAHAARCAVDQHLRSGLDAAVVAQALQCRERSDRDGGRLLEGYVCRLQCHAAALANDDVLRDGAVRAAEYFIAGLEARDVLADCFDGAREVDADARVLRRAQARAQAHDVGRAAHHVPVERVQRRGAHFHEHLIVSRRRLGDLFELQHFGSAITARDQAFHGVAPGGQRRLCAARRVVAQRDGERDDCHGQHDREDTQDAVA